MSIDPFDGLKPGRVITGMTAVYLPFSAPGVVDWAGFEQHLARTVASGLVPAVNMDTGSTQFIDAATRAQVLKITASQCKRFVAGAFVADQQGAPFALAKYRMAVAEVTAHGGTPIIFPSWGLNALNGNRWVAALGDIGHECEGFYAFELGPQFVPYGRIYDLNTYTQLMRIGNCLGAKHSSLSRQLEWQRLSLRDTERPDFQVLTGNDLAIDMVMYGSDYLLGLSTFAPDAFARRDAYWRDRDARFFELNDTLQYLGQFAFRDPVPSYRHNAAQFLKIRGWIENDTCPPGAVPRPAEDVAALRQIAERLNELLG